MSGIIGDTSAVNAAREISPFSGVQFGTSCYGVPVPIVYGKTRYAGNIIWMPPEFWRKVPGTKANTGKGGQEEVKQKDIPDTYEQGVAVALCEGPIGGVGAVWRDKDYFVSLAEMSAKGGGALSFFNGVRAQDPWSYFNSTPVQRYAVKFSVPLSSPYTHVLADAGFISIVTPVGSPPNSIYGLYDAGDTQGRIWRELPTQANAGINPHYYVMQMVTGVGPTFTFSSACAGIDVEIVYLATTDYSPFALGYGGTAYLITSALPLGSSNSMKNFSFEVTGFLNDGNGADPAAVVVDLLTNSVYGCGWLSSQVETVLGQDGTAASGYARYCVAMGFKISPVIKESKPALEHVKEILAATNAEMVWSEGKLKIIPLGDEVVGSFAPVTTPVFDITPAHLRPLSSGLGAVESLDDGPIQVTRVRQADTYNSWPVEYIDRNEGDLSNGYNVNLVTATEQADVERTGEVRAHETEQLHAITNLAHAQVIGKLRVQRSCYIRNTYKFKTGMTFSVLDPLDIVTLTEPKLGLDRRPVRIRVMEEDPVAQEITFEAEECIIGVAAAASHETQVGEGGGQDFGANPYASNQPVIFAPPLAATESGAPELWIATSGMAKDWGGAQVWVSWDAGASYKYYGDAKAAVYGVLDQTLQAGPLVDDVNTCHVNLLASSGVLSSATQADRDALATACWVDGEVIAYQNAVLQPDGTYHLTSLVRGARQTLASVHASGAPFIFLDSNVVRLPIDLNRYGQTVFVKLVSFNLSRSNIQDIATVQVYQYTLPSIRTATEVSSTLPVKFSFDTFIREDWQVVSGSGVIAIAAGGLDGGNVLRVTGALTLLHKTLIPVGPYKPYGVAATMKQVQNPSTGGRAFHVGFVGVREDGVTICGLDGTSNLAVANQYLSVAIEADPAGWHEAEGYEQARRGDATAGTPPRATPGVFHRDVRYVRLMLVMNSAGGNGIQDVDSIEFWNASDEFSSSSAVAIAQIASAAATEAQTLAAVASVQASAAYTAISDMAADDKLTPAEKGAVIRDLFALANEQATIDAKASAYNITVAKDSYDTAIADLRAYLISIGLGLYDPIPSTPDTSLQTWCANTSTINGATLRSTFNMVYSTRQVLLDVIVNVTRTIADNALGTAATASATATAAQTAAASANNAATAAQTAANNAVGVANTANAAIADISADNKLTPAEKGAMVRDFFALENEKLNLQNQAGYFGVETSSQAMNYADAMNALESFVANIGGTGQGITSSSTDAQIATWCGTTSNVDGAAMRAVFSTAYNRRTALLTLLAVKAKEAADEAQAAADAATSLAGRVHTFYDTVAQRNAAQSTGLYNGQLLIQGDIWFDTDQNYHPWRWSGTQWLDTHDTTPLIASQILTGMITADKIHVNAIATGNYASAYDGSGKEYASAGAKMQKNAVAGETAILVDKNSLRIGRTYLRDSWFSKTSAVFGWVRIERDFSGNFSITCGGGFLTAFSVYYNYPDKTALRLTYPAQALGELNTNDPLRVVAIATPRANLVSNTPMLHVRAFTVDGTWGQSFGDYVTIGLCVSNDSSWTMLNCEDIPNNAHVYFDVMVYAIPLTGEGFML